MKITDLLSSPKDKQLFNQLVGDALKSIIDKAGDNASISQADDAGASKKRSRYNSYQPLSSPVISNPSPLEGARSASKGKKAIPYTPPPKSMPIRPLYPKPDNRSF
jgi:hypothetical protein